MSEGPRFILYHQTHHDANGKPHSLIPLLTNNTGVTHVILAALHLNEGPGNVTLNNDPPDHERFGQLWEETRWLRGAGVKVMMMLGGAAQGTYERLSRDDASFEAYYAPLLALLRNQSLSGVDLDIEEPMTYPHLRRLILRLRADMGASFLISLAPVSTALLPDPRVPVIFPVFALLQSLPHLSGDALSYFRLEGDPELRGAIAWYNVQFYCGWGSAADTDGYEAIVRAGWDPSRVVLGVVTNERNGTGIVQLERLCSVIERLTELFPSFGGVMGWEYFNAGTAPDRPWEWVARVARAVRPPPRSKWKEEDIAWLMEMGADRAKAEQALAAASGNVEEATGFLFPE